MATSDKLSIADLSVILMELRDARFKWKDIGVELSLGPGTLEAIAFTERDNPDNCLREVLAVWLRRAVKPTWGAIAYALKQPSTGMGQLACEIERVHHVGPPPKGGYFTRQAIKPPAAAPSMKQLSKLNVFSIVAPKWRELSDLLEIDSGTTADIEDEHLDPEMACRAVVVRWLKGEGSWPSWETLLKAMDDMRYGEFAAELREKLERI